MNEHAKRHGDGRLSVRKSLGKIDVTLLDGVWGWEGYLEGSGRSEDSDDITLDEGETVEGVSDEALLLGVGLTVSNPLARGCELEIHRAGQMPAAYRWKGGNDVTKAEDWEKAL